ncbi:MAG: helix-turn-helix domain-containing protein [Pseudomonadota bacterium]
MTLNTGTGNTAVEAKTEADEQTDQGKITIDLTQRPLSAVIQEVEQRYFGHVMTKTGGNKAAAARMSGMADDTFRKKIKRYTFETVFRCV